MDKSSLDSSNALIVAVVAATCPPADPPPAIIFSGSTPNFHPANRRLAVTDAGFWLSLMFTFRPIVRSKSNHSTGCQIIRMPGKLGVRSTIPSAPEEKDHRRIAYRSFSNYPDNRYEEKVFPVEYFCTQELHRGLPYPKQMNSGRKGSLKKEWMSI